MDDVPDLSSDEDCMQENDWQEMETIDEAVNCLFCSTVFPNIDGAINHAAEAHNFRLGALKEKHNMDCYSYIQLINYIRSTKSNGSAIMSAKNPIWLDEQYLKPIVNDDWLTYDFESMAADTSESSIFHANVESGVVTLSQAHFSELQRTIQNLSTQIKEKDSLLNLAGEDIEKMKSSMQTLIVDGGISSSTNVKGSVDIVNCVSKVALEDDQGYFNSYAHFGIHHEMLSDKVRTMSYQGAILGNTTIIKDKKVLDLGCGTGVLSMFAATAGAKLVYALDQSDIVYHAMDIIHENKLQDTIKVIKGRLEDTKLPEKVDVIISEWMGYFLLFEGMLDSVIYARDNWLNPEGVLLPNRCNISIVGNGDVETHNQLINFWSDVYGYKMNCMKSEVVREASIQIVDSQHILTTPYVVKDIDINTCTTDVMDFTSTFSLPVTKDGKLTSLVGYFDTFFELPSNVSFSTGPQTTATHWKQTVFYLRDCISVKQGEVITGKMTCNRSRSDVRALSVIIDLFGKSYKFIIS